MATTRLTPDQINRVCRLVAQYIASQREKYAPQAIPLAVVGNEKAGFVHRGHRA